jgi:hypothetical protein
MKKLITEPATHQQATLLSLGDIVQWQRLGTDLEPKLTLNGTNFPAWSSALCSLVDLVTGSRDYFSIDRSTADPTTLVQVMALIWHLVDVLLRTSLNGMNAYGAFSLLKGCFAGSSWSLLLTRWSDIAQAPDLSDSVSSGYESIKRSLLDLEERLGGWTTDKLLSLSFHSSLKSYANQLADSMDSCMAIDPLIQVKSTNLLTVATWLHQAHVSSSPAPGLMALSSQRPVPSLPPLAGCGGRGQGSTCGGRGSGQPSGNPSAAPSSDPANLPPDSWGKNYLTSELPCNVCWKWGDWAPDCPCVKNNQPPLENLQLKNPSWRPKKFNVLSRQLVSKQEDLASVLATPDHAEDVLCNTWATNTMKKLLLLVIKWHLASSSYLSAIYPA